MTMPMCGGLGAPQAATADIQKLCDQLKPEAEEKAEKKFNLFTAVSYKTQVVAGTNYFIKVLVGENECLHIRVFLPTAACKCTTITKRSRGRQAS